MILIFVGILFLVFGFGCFVLGVYHLNQEQKIRNIPEQEHQTFIKNFNREYQDILSK